MTRDINNGHLQGPSPFTLLSECLAVELFQPILMTNDLPQGSQRSGIEDCVVLNLHENIPVV